MDQTNFNGQLTPPPTEPTANNPEAVDNLQALAEYFGVTLKELLEKAGYVEPSPTEETEVQRVEKAFPHVLNDPDFKYGTRIKGNCDIDTKRFIIEMYEKTTGRKLLWAK